MGNLIKYEWRKQRMTRILILACLLAFVVLFVAGAVLRNDTLVAISILIMTFAGMFGILYVGIENIVILNRDLKTKQSYMLWMVPHSTYEILASFREYSRCGLRRMLMQCGRMWRSIG